MSKGGREVVKLVVEIITKRKVGERGREGINRLIKSSTESEVSETGRK